MAMKKFFNEMTAELGENRRDLEERRRYIETVLQSLSAGVISLNAQNNSLVFRSKIVEC